MFNVTQGRGRSVVVMTTNGEGRVVYGYVKLSWGNKIILSRIKKFVSQYFFNNRVLKADMALIERIWVRQAYDEY